MGWREGLVSNFLLSPLPSEIGDLLVRISTSEKEKVCRGQIWRVGRLGENSRLMRRQNSRIRSASVSRHSKNFAATRRIFSLSVKIRWHKRLQIPTSSATSRTVGRRF